MKAINLITNNIHIKKKLILSYLLVVFIPVLVVGLFLTHALRQMAIDRAIQQSHNNVDKIKKRTEDVLKIPTDISSKIFFDKKLKALVAGNYQSTWDIVSAYNDYTDFTDYLRVYKEVSAIRFYSDNETLLNNWTLFKIDSGIRDAEWFGDGMNSRGKIGWHYIPDLTQQNQRYLSLVREIFYDNMSFCGMLVLTVNPDLLNSIVSQEPFETMIITDQDEIIAAKDVNLIGNSLKKLNLDTVLGSKEEGIGDIRYQGQAAKAMIEPVYVENSNNSLRIVSIIPVDSISKEARDVGYVAFTIIFLSLLVSLVMILFFSSALTKRIGLLSRELRMVARGDFTRTTEVDGTDEIGQLGRHFNFMVRSIDELMREVTEANRQRNDLLLKQKEIKLQMLANQINPHFLFNVLETIRMKAHVGGENEIANAVKSLGKLLRHNLEIMNDPVPLAVELEIARSYLEIQKFRFGAKVDYELPLKEEAEGLMILPMILQPIVENAIVHGLENKEGRGKITVRLEKGDGKAALIVNDDGNGIDQARMNRILQSLDGPDEEMSRHIGLRNVHQRLKLQYGPEYGLEIRSDPGMGTTVSIKFPTGVNVYV